MSKKGINTKSSHLIARPEAELAELLQERLDVLLALCSEYDSGRRYFATDIATKLRVLLLSASETKNPSLLKQLGKTDLEFVDTVQTVNNGNPMHSLQPASGMAISTVHQAADGYEQDWQPWCYGRIPVASVHRTKFRWWWENAFFLVGDQALSRKAITKQLAEEDGGAHVSKDIEKIYFELTRGDVEETRHQLIEGDAVTDMGAPVAPERITSVSRKLSGTKLVRAIVRQIAHETLMTLLDDPAEYEASIPMISPGVVPVVFSIFDLVEPRAYPEKSELPNGDRPAINFRMLYK